MQALTAFLELLDVAASSFMCAILPCFMLQHTTVAPNRVHFTLRVLPKGVHWATAPDSRGVVQLQPRGQMVPSTALAMPVITGLPACELWGYLMWVVSHWLVGWL